MLKLKGNYKMYKKMHSNNLDCRACGQSLETQDDIVTK